MRICFCEIWNVIHYYNYFVTFIFLNFTSSFVWTLCRHARSIISVSQNKFVSICIYLKETVLNCVNIVFGKVAGDASEEVPVKCLPVLLYGLEACPISNKQCSSHSTLYWTAAIERYFEQGLLKLCKIVCSCSICLSCRSVLQNANINFLQIMLNLITYYAMSVKTLRRMNWIC